jgi:hypothetical protein
MARIEAVALQRFSQPAPPYIPSEWGVSAIVALIGSGARLICERIDLEPAEEVRVAPVNFSRRTLGDFKSFGARNTSARALASRALAARPSATHKLGKDALQSAKNPRRLFSNG